MPTSSQSGHTTLDIKAIYVMENTLAIIKSWMSANSLKMNHCKIEFIIYGSRQQLKNLLINSLKMNESSNIKFHKILKGISGTETWKSPFSLQLFDLQQMGFPCCQNKVIFQTAKNFK